MLKRTRGFVDKYNAVLRWWLMFSALCVGLFFAHNASMAQRFIEADKTCISLVIFGLFVLFTIIVGHDTYKLCRNGYSRDIQDRVEYGWFAADVFTGLGFVGTLIGFIVMFENFSGDLTTQVALAQMSRGMSIALHTTVAGLVCSIALKIQLFNASQFLDRCKDACENVDV